MLRGVAPNAPVRHEVRATLVVEIVVAERLAVPRRKDAARDTVGTHMVGLPIIAVALSHKKTQLSLNLVAERETHHYYYYYVFPSLSFFSCKQKNGG
jgi:hypothetical protein